MGRLFVWQQLAPDFWLSPIWGRGLGSTAWNTAVTSGHLVVGQPHNAYLAMLLDIGIVGFAAMMYLYYRYGRTLSKLSSESSLSPMVRDYFSGAFASFLGMLAFAVTAGQYRPHPEQTFLWFALGFAFSYWHLAQSPGKSASRRLFGVSTRQVPLG
jgi:O-antigen ligase